MSSSVLPGCGGVCLSDGGLAGLVFGCIFGTLVLGTVAALILWRIRERQERAAKHAEVIEFSGRKTEESGPYRLDRPVAYANGGFLDESVLSGSVLNVDEPGGHVLVEPRKAKSNGVKAEKKRFVKDHSYSTDSLTDVHEILSVPLKSQDQNGLGFNVRGNMREGIFVKDVRQRGPAIDSGKIETGDRILSVKVSFENMVFEDALTILSYASPYNVTVELLKSSRSTQESDYSKRYSQADLEPAIILAKEKRTAQVHPLFKSHSVDDMELGGEVVGTSPSKEARRTKSVQPYKNFSSAKETPTLVVSEDSDRTISGRSSSSSKRAISPTYLSPNRSTTTSRKSNNSSVSEKSVQESVYLSDATLRTPAKEDPYGSLSMSEKLEVLQLSYEDNIEAPPLTQSPAVPLSPREEKSKRMPKLTKFAKLLSSGNSSSSDPSKSPEQAPKEKLSAKKALQFSDLSQKSESEEQDGFSTARPPTSSSSYKEEQEEEEKTHSPRAKVHAVRSKTRSRSIERSSESSENAKDTSPPRRDTLSPPRTVLTKAASDSAEPHPTRTYLNTKHGLKPSMEQSNWLRPKGLEGEGELDEEQYEKLMYFQRQLAIQHEELTQMGISIPMSLDPVVQVNGHGSSSSDQRNGIA